MARTSDAKPAVKTAYELVQRFLLIGNTRPHAWPTSINAAPPTASQVALRDAGRDDPSTNPPSTPSRVVVIAGIVLSRPSGSQVGFHKCPCIRARSMRAPRLPSGVKSPAIRNQ